MFEASSTYGSREGSHTGLLVTSRDKGNYFWRSQLWEDWSCTKRLYVATDPCTHLSVDFSLYEFVVIEFILLTWPALFVKVYDLYLLDCNAFFCSVQNKLNKTINI